MRLMPLFNTEGTEGGTTATADFTAEKYQELEKNYKKLEAEFTKVTQKNSDLSKDADKVKPWLDFDKMLEDLGTKTGQDVKGLAGAQLDALVNSLASGKAPTQQQMSQLGKAIDKAEEKGDDETVKRLEYLESKAMEAELSTTLSSIEETAKKDGIEFNRKEFQEFADAWLEDMGIGDDDEFDTKLLRKAYDAYEAKKLKEQRKNDIPPLGTSGGAGAPTSTGEGQKVGGLKGAAQRAKELLKN